MKIGTFFNIAPFSGPTRPERSEGEGGHAREQYSRQDQKDPKDQEREKPKSLDPRQIDEAVQSFQDDEAARAHGLSATVEGSGPGLKIHVKDCNGTTLRQFSGEEFLRLREASGITGKRGKILDQKL